MKKKTVAIVLVSVLAGVVLAALLGNLQQPTYTYRATDASATTLNEQEATAVAALSYYEDGKVEPIQVPETKGQKVVFDTIHSVTVSYPIGRDTTYVFIPYLRGNIRDVGTAGSSNWTCEYGAVVMAWRGGKKIEVKKLHFDANFTTTADDNTVLNLEWPSQSTHVTGSRYDVHAEENRVSLWDSHRAATIDSTLEENKPCAATLRWEGECAVPRTLFKPAVGVQFSVEAQLPYVGNVK